MVAGCLHAERGRRKEDAEIYEDNPAHSQSMVCMELAQLPINPAKSAVGRMEYASLTYLGYVRLCSSGPWSSERYCQIPGKKWKKVCLEKKDTTNLKKGGWGGRISTVPSQPEKRRACSGITERKKPSCERGKKARTCTEFTGRDQARPGSHTKERIHKIYTYMYKKFQEGYDEND